MLQIKLDGKIKLSLHFAGLSGDEFKFNKSTGDGPARYNIIHYKQVSLGKYDRVTVGDFHDGDIFLNMTGKKV